MAFTELYECDYTGCSNTFKVSDAHTAQVIISIDGAPAGNTALCCSKDHAQKQAAAIVQELTPAPSSPTPEPAQAPTMTTNPGGLASGGSTTTSA